jgi:hypothetical protein
VEIKPSGINNRSDPEQVPLTVEKTPQWNSRGLKFRSISRDARQSGWESERPLFLHVLRNCGESNSAVFKVVSGKNCRSVEKIP